MDDRKSKKTGDGQSKSKSPRTVQPREDQLKKRESSRPKFRVSYGRSRSRSPPRERKRSRREDESPPSYHRQSPADRRQRISSSRYESSYKARRHHSQSPSQNDSRQQLDTTFQEETPSRVLGVFGLSMYTDERVLKDVFTQYGPVEDIQVILDHYSNVSRGFAFVYMKHMQDAIQAKELAPGTEIDGRRIRVDYSVTDYSPNLNAAGSVGQPVYSRPHQNLRDPYQRSARHSPPPPPPSFMRHHHLSGNGSRYVRDRSRSYSPRHF